MPPNQQSAIRLSSLRSTEPSNLTTDYLITANRKWHGFVMLDCIQLLFSLWTKEFSLYEELKSGNTRISATPCETLDTIEKPKNPQGPSGSTVRHTMYLYCTDAFHLSMFSTHLSSLGCYNVRICFVYTALYGTSPSNCLLSGLVVIN